ncbi:Palladin [Microtus ochrogaster]|uniref:Palladin n=1 Tax=Microtus ochrogaster TaxID=79684 RepID=A0A8J6G6Q9_MICOH|nr:Palladin [Microtus ochrogaster]
MEKTSGFQGKPLAQKHLQPPDIILPLTLSDLYLSTSPELQKTSGPLTLILQCRKWFCEGKELFNSPDIQIQGDGAELHTLVIAEAFEDDTGRYSCLATNPSGSDTTSAEVFIEGKWGVAG